MTNFKKIVQKYLTEIHRELVPKLSICSLGRKVQSASIKHTVGRRTIAKRKEKLCIFPRNQQMDFQWIVKVQRGVRNRLRKFQKVFETTHDLGKRMSGNCEMRGFKCKIFLRDATNLHVVKRDVVNAGFH